jgi:AcrR family transcriptional regulator
VKSPRSRPDGRTTRWDAHREARRSELIDAAILAVRDYGDAVGMDQIAAVAHTSKPVIYRYFSDKADLYRAIGQRMAAALGRIMAAATAGHSDPRARLHAGVDSYLSVLDETPELYQFVISNSASDRRGADGAVLENFLSMFEAFLTAEVRDSFAQHGVEPGAATPWAVGIVGFMRAIGDWWLANRAQMTRSELAEYVTVTLWAGLSSTYAAAGVEVDVSVRPGLFGPAPSRPGRTGPSSSE